MDRMGVGHSCKMLHYHEKKWIFFSASDCELLPFYLSHCFPIFAWGLCMVLASRHWGTTNRRYSASKGICQVRDRSKALQGMTAGSTCRPHKTFLSVFSSLPLFIFASTPACPRFSPLYLCNRAQPQAFKSCFQKLSTWMASDCVKCSIVAGLRALNDKQRFTECHFV